MIAAPRSRIYRGTLRHRRFTPKPHAFSYQVWMAWLDLDELPELFDKVPGFSARWAACLILSPSTTPTTIWVDW